VRLAGILTVVMDFPGSRGFWRTPSAITVVAPNGNYELQKKSQIFIEFHDVRLRNFRFVEREK